MVGAAAIREHSGALEVSSGGVRALFPVGTGWGRPDIVYDVNGDGLNDVVSSLEAHGWGLAWFEQKRERSGGIYFERHMIMDNFSTKNAGGVTFSELHAMTVADVDGDGIPDIITGKRYWSHLEGYTTPDPMGPRSCIAITRCEIPKRQGARSSSPNSSTISRAWDLSSPRRT